MNCEQCGTPIAEDQKLCSQCAAKKQQEIVLEQTTEAPGKNNKKLLLGIVAAVVAVAIVAAVLCLGPLKGFCVKQFGSPADYMLFVETKAAADGIEDFAEVYGKALESYARNDEYSTDGQIHLLVGDSVLTLLEQQLAAQGLSAGLDFLQDIALTFRADCGQEQLAADLELGLGQTQILDLGLYIDYAAQNLLFGLPSLNESYLKMPLEEQVSNPAELIAIYRLLPSAKNTAAVLKTYTDILHKYLSKVEKSAQTLTVEGIEQDFTVLTLTVTSRDVSDLTLEILETAQTDKELETFLDDLSAFVNGYNELIGETAETVDLHAEMIEGIPDAKKEIEIQSAELTDDDYLQLTDFVDSKHNICGRKVEEFTDNVSDGNFYYLTVTDGKESALEARYCVEDAEMLHISGKYTQKDDLFSGSFDIAVEQISYMTLESNCTEETVELELTPTNAFLQDVLELDATASAVLGITSPSLKIAASADDGQTKTEIYLNAGDNMLAGITYDVTLKDYSPAAAPTGPFVDGEDNDAVMTWSNELDFRKLTDNLKAAGVSQDLLNGLLAMLMGI